MPKHDKSPKMDVNLVLIRFIMNDCKHDLVMSQKGYNTAGRWVCLVRNNKEEPRLVSSDEWFLGKYSPFSCEIFPRDIFIAFYGNFRPCFRHISLRNIFPRSLSFGNNNKMSRNEALQLCFQKKYYWLPAV
jgi:hypothetical protein